MSLVSPFVDALRQVEGWPCEHAAVAVVGAVEGSVGDRGRRFAWASVTKLATAVAMLVAAEEGIVDLDEPAGPPGLDVPAPARARVGAAVRSRRADRAAGRAPRLLELRLRGRRSAGRGAGRMPFTEYFAHVWGDTTARAVGLGRLGRGGDARRPARARARAARADAHRAGDAGRGVHRAVPRASSACCPASAGRSRTTGASASSCATRSRRTGRARATRRGRSATSAAAARSCGSTRTRTSRSRASPTCAFGDWAAEAWPRLSDAVLAETA